MFPGWSVLQRPVGVAAREESLVSRRTPLSATMPYHWLRLRTFYQLGKTEFQLGET